MHAFRVCTHSLSTFVCVVLDVCSQFYSWLCFLFLCTICFRLPPQLTMLLISHDARSISKCLPSFVCFINVGASSSRRTLLLAILSSPFLCLCFLLLRRLRLASWKRGPNSRPCGGHRHLAKPRERNVGRNIDSSPTVIGRSIETT